MIQIIQNTSYFNKLSNDESYWLRQYTSDNIDLWHDRKANGVYILCNYSLLSRQIIYVGQGQYYGRIFSHSAKTNKNNHWTHGFIIEVENKILRQMLEKLLIKILKPKNNIKKPTINHMILAEELTSMSVDI